MSTTWNEDDTRVYRSLARIAVPRRREQVAMLLTLMPFGRTEAFRVVELGCGEGILAAAVLECFGNATLIALDGSADMRQATQLRAAKYGSRIRIDSFDLADSSWRQQLGGADCVLSSLVLHHLAAADKQRLFEDVAAGLTPRGAMLIADLVEPSRPEARELFAATWDRLAESEAEVLRIPSAYDAFVRERWNYYRHPDPVDQPSGMFDQLTWLRAAGFATADCFWLEAGHAIYGGYLAAATKGTVPFADALALADAVIPEP